MVSRGLTSFFAECFCPGVDEAQLAGWVSRAREAARELTATGSEVRVTGSWLVPTDEVVFLLLEAVSVERAREVSDRAGVPYERVVEAISVSGAAME